MLDTNFPPWPSFTEEEVDAVSEVLRSNRVNYWTGDVSRAFEREFAAWSGTRHAIALANGTVALDLALRALEIGAHNGGAAQDEVIVAPRTFLASASAIVNAGAAPSFCDVDRDSGNLTADSVAAVLSDRTRAIIAVHLAGWPCEMDPINALAADHGLAVIEDCAQAHGATYRGRSVGALGTIAAWSFCQDKIMTTGGEGGMVTCDDEELWRRMWEFKDHGKSWDAVYAERHPPGFRWLHHSFGTNFRITEMQSAIGRIQLARMPDWHAARSSNADQLRAGLARFCGHDGPIRIPQIDEPGTQHAYYKFYAYVRPENLAKGWDRDRIVREINSAGVPAYQGSCSEVYLERAFDNSPFRPAVHKPVARELGETSLMFLVHPTLRADDLDRTVAVASGVLARAVR